MGGRARRGGHRHSGVPVPRPVDELLRGHDPNRGYRGGLPGGVLRLAGRGQRGDGGLMVVGDGARDAVVDGDSCCC